MKKKERKTLRKKQSDSYDLVFEMMQIYEKVRRYFKKYFVQFLTL